MGHCQVSDMEPVVSVVEASSAWCSLKRHAYLIKPDGAGLFRCAWPFDGHYASIVYWCVWCPLMGLAYANKTAAVGFV